MNQITIFTNIDDLENNKTIQEIETNYINYNIKDFLYWLDWWLIDWIETIKADVKFHNDGYS